MLHIRRFFYQNMYCIHFLHRCNQNPHTLKIHSHISCFFSFSFYIYGYPLFNLAINLFASNVFPFLSTTLPCLSFQRILEINFFHYTLLSKIYTCLNKTSISQNYWYIHSKIVSTTLFSSQDL